MLDDVYFIESPIWEDPYPYSSGGQPQEVPEGNNDTPDGGVDAGTPPETSDGNPSAGVDGPTPQLEVPETNDDHPDGGVDVGTPQTSNDVVTDIDAPPAPEVSQWQDNHPDGGLVTDIDAPPALEVPEWNDSHPDGGVDVSQPQEPWIDQLPSPEVAYPSVPQTVDPIYDSGPTFTEDKHMDEYDYSDDTYNDYSDTSLPYDDESGDGGSPDTNPQVDAGVDESVDSPPPPEAGQTIYDDPSYIDNGDGTYTSPDGFTTDADGQVIDSGDVTMEPGSGYIDNGDGTFTSPDGFTVNGDGSAVAGNGYTDNGDGTFTSPDGLIVNPDGTAVTGTGYIDNGDGTFTSPDGLLVNPDGSAVTGNGYIDNGDGTFTSPDGFIVDANGLVTSQPGDNGYIDNGDGTFISPDGLLVDANGYAITPNNTASQPSSGRQAGGSGGGSSGGGGPSGGGSSGTGSSQAKPATTSPAATVLSKKRVGNDLVTTYSDGTQQIIRGYFGNAAVSSGSLSLGGATGLPHATSNPAASPSSGGILGTLAGGFLSGLLGPTNMIKPTPGSVGTTRPGSINLGTGSGVIGARGIPSAKTPLTKTNPKGTSTLSAGGRLATILSPTSNAMVPLAIGGLLVIMLVAGSRKSSKSRR